MRASGELRRERARARHRQSSNSFHGPQTSPAVSPLVSRRAPRPTRPGRAAGDVGHPPSRFAPRAETSRRPDARDSARDGRCKKSTSTHSHESRVDAHLSGRHDANLVRGMTGEPPPTWRRSTRPTDRPTDRPTVTADYEPTDRPTDHTSPSVRPSVLRITPRGVPINRTRVYNFRLFVSSVEGTCAF